MNTYDCVRTDNTFDLKWIIAIVCELKQDGKIDKDDEHAFFESLLSEEEK